MSKFRKKPVEIEAFQYLPDESNRAELLTIYGLWGGAGGRGELIGMTTIHGDTAYARPGDWIARESDPTKFYPIKADVFAATYEPVDGAA